MDTCTRTHANDGVQYTHRNASKLAMTTCVNIQGPISPRQELHFANNGAASELFQQFVPNCVHSTSRRCWHCLGYGRLVSVHQFAVSLLNTFPGLCKETSLITNWFRIDGIGFWYGRKMRCPGTQFPSRIFLATRTRHWCGKRGTQTPVEHGIHGVTGVPSVNDVFSSLDMHPFNVPIQQTCDRGAKSVQKTSKAMH